MSKAFVESMKAAYRYTSCSMLFSRICVRVMCVCVWWEGGGVRVCVERETEGGGGG